MPTTAWFIFGDDNEGSIKAIALAFKSHLYGQVLPRLVLDFGQPTEQQGASLLWKIGSSGVLLSDRGKGKDFHIYMTTDAAMLRRR